MAVTGLQRPTRLLSSLSVDSKLSEMQFKARDANSNFVTRSEPSTPTGNHGFRRSWSVFTEESEATLEAVINRAYCGITRVVTMIERNRAPLPEPLVFVLEDLPHAEERTWFMTTLQVGTFLIRAYEMYRGMF